MPPNRLYSFSHFTRGEAWKNPRRLPAHAGAARGVLASKAGNTKAVIQFNLTGEDGGTYSVGIADGKCSGEPRPATAPNATVTASAADYLASRGTS